MTDIYADFAGLVPALMLDKNNVMRLERQKRPHFAYVIEEVAFHSAQVVMGMGAWVRTSAAW